MPQLRQGRRDEAKALTSRPRQGRDNNHKTEASKRRVYRLLWLSRKLQLTRTDTQATSSLTSTSPQHQPKSCQNMQLSNRATAYKWASLQVEILTGSHSLQQTHCTTVGMTTQQPHEHQVVMLARRSPRSSRRSGSFDLSVLVGLSDIRAFRGSKEYPSAIFCSSECNHRLLNLFIGCLINTTINRYANEQNDCSNSL